MSRCRISHQAQRDLDEIWLFIAQDNPVAADRVMDLFLDKFKALVRRPGMGRMRNELAPGLRSLAVGHYIVFYRGQGNVIEIIRVLHGARDIETEFQ